MPNNRYERFHVIVNSIETGLLDSSVIISPEFVNQTLDKNQLKSALDFFLQPELGQQPMAHVVLDKSVSDGIFSPHLNEEARASVECLREIQTLVTAQDQSVLKAPLIVVTSTGGKVKVVILRPVKGKLELHFFDPYSGSRDIQSQTTHAVWRQYLENGSQEHQLPSMALETTPDCLGSCAGCKNQDATGWWCLFYCLVFLRKRNDEFLFKSQVDLASKDHLNRLKTLMAVHLPNQFLEAQTAPKDDSGIDLTEFCALDQGIGNEFETCYAEINKAASSLRTSNELAEKEREALEELIKKRGRMEEDAKQLEESIRLREELVLASQANSAGLGTSERSSQFISGQVLRNIEAQSKEKEDKAKNLILTHNKKIHADHLKEQVAVIEELVKADDSSIFKLTHQVEENERETRNESAKVDSCRSRIEQLNRQIANSKALMRGKQAAIANKQNASRGISAIRSDTEPARLLNALLDNCSNRSSILERLRTDLDRTENSLRQLQAAKQQDESAINSDINSKTSSETQADLQNGKIGTLRSRCWQLESEIRDVQKEIDGFWRSLWNAFSDDGLESKKRNLESDLYDRRRELGESERLRDVHNSEIARLALSIKNRNNSVREAETKINAENAKKIAYSRDHQG